MSYTLYNADQDSNVKMCCSTKEGLDTSSRSLSYLVNMHMRNDHCEEGWCNEAAVEHGSLSEFSLSDLANMHLANTPSLANTGVDDVVTGDVGQQIKNNVSSLSTDGLSLTDLVNLHTSDDLVMHEEEGEEEASVLSHSLDNLSLSELASVHMSTHSNDKGCSSYKETTSSVDLPVIKMNPHLASLEFTTGFTIPKTGSTLSLSQLASLGSSSTSSKSSRLSPSKPLPFHDDTSGLTALTVAHFNSLEDDNVTGLIDVKPPPGLVPAEFNVVSSSQDDTPLIGIVDRHAIKNHTIGLANASVFATIVCMTEREKPKRLVKRHKHLKRKSWRALINPHKARIPFFTFHTPSPDDYVLQKQKQVFNS